MAKNTAGSYHRTMIYLTDEQWRWLSRLSEKELRKALIAHVRSEAER